MKLISLIMLMLASGIAYGGGDPVDAEFETKARRGIDLVYNLEFAEAEQLFQELTAKYPRHPAGHFFLAMVDWWRIMIDIENTQYDDRFTGALEKVVDLCDELLDEDETDVTALFFKGGALGFIGRLKFHRDDWFAAANAGRQALPIVQDASVADPQNYDVFLGTGIYNYYAAVIPEQYPVAKPLLLFIPPGDKKKGIEQLQTAASKGKYASVEAKYFLMQLFYLYEKEYAKALAIASELHERYPNNMLFHRYVGRCHITMGDYRSAGVVFAEIDKLVDAGKPGYNATVEREAEYYLGLVAMMGGDYTAALEHFYRSDEMSRVLDTEGPSGFMAMTNLNVGKVYDLQLRRDKAVVQYNKVLEMKEYRDTHEQAERFLKTPYSR